MATARSAPAAAAAKVAQPPSRPYLRNVPGGHAVPADALTGEPLRPGSYRLRVSSERLDGAPTRQSYADGFRADATPCPVRLHTPEVETTGGSSDPRGGLGGHIFARQFARYLASGLAERRLNTAYAERVWWGTAYGRQRVLARFRRDDDKHGPVDGATAYRVALAVASGYLSYDEVIAETGQTARWVTLQQLRADTYQREPATGTVRSVRAIEPRRDRRQYA